MDHGPTWWKEPVLRSQLWFSMKTDFTLLQLSSCSYCTATGRRKNMLTKVRSVEQPNINYGDYRDGDEEKINVRQDWFSQKCIFVIHLTSAADTNPALLYSPVLVLFMYKGLKINLHNLQNSWSLYCKAFPSPLSTPGWYCTYYDISQWQHFASCAREQYDDVWCFNRAGRTGHRKPHTVSTQKA